MNMKADMKSAVIIAIIVIVVITVDSRGDGSFVQLY